MSATARPSVLVQLLRALPRPVREALDAWSYRIAQRRARQRQQRWAQRKA